MTPLHRASCRVFLDTASRCRTCVRHVRYPGEGARRMPSRRGSGYVLARVGDTGLARCLAAAPSACSRRPSLAALPMLGTSRRGRRSSRWHGLSPLGRHGTSRNRGPLHAAAWSHYETTLLKREQLLLSLLRMIQSLTSTRFLLPLLPFHGKTIHAKTKISRHSVGFPAYTQQPK